MKKNRVVLCCMLCLVVANTAWSQDAPIRVAFWNMENFFDPFVDSTKTYNEFTEDGGQHWTKSRFYRKRNNMYKAILALSENRPIGILGMCEVENEYVLNAIFEQTPLKKHNYRYVHYEGPDKRGIDPAIVYSLDHFMLVESAVFPYYNPQDKLKDVYNYAVYLGKLYAGYTYDYMMNDYVDTEMAKKNNDWNRFPLRYDPYKRQVIYAEEGDWFIEIK